jgi:uncharacterized protein (TIGR01777 family)
VTKRVAITGSTGLMGGALRQFLAGRGDEVVRLVRGPARAPDERTWEPTSGMLPLESLDGVDAVVNLAGAGIGDRRWNAGHKRLVESSRVQATGTIGHALTMIHGQTGRRIRLVNGSAVGFYGDRGDEVLSEQSEAGTDFLAGVVQRWEAATQEAVVSGLPVASLRTGLVMARHGGAFAKLLLLSRLGLGGPLGSGQEWWPWVTLADATRAIAHLIDHPEVEGPVNVVAPAPARQREIAAEIGRQLARPAILPAPRLALRAVVGEFADSILASQRVTPARLLESGFVFEHPDLETAVRWMLAR